MAPRIIEIDSTWRRNSSRSHFKRAFPQLIQFPLANGFLLKAAATLSLSLSLSLSLFLSLFLARTYNRAVYFQSDTKVISLLDRVMFKGFVWKSAKFRGDLLANI